MYGDLWESHVNRGSWLEVLIVTLNFVMLNQEQRTVKDRPQ
jgi:hypothetical protein